METDRWKQVEQLCHAALEREPAQQAAFLKEACAGDETLRREVESLLAYQKQADHFIDVPALDVAAKALAEDDASCDASDQLVGRRIGPYQVVGRIAIGGMGEVYRAFRADDQYNKQVAIKLVRAGQDSGFVISRFKNERQILAALDHPNIARLFDGGTTEEGMPYFVMELIEGEPIIEYCDSCKLSTTDRLKLFSQVCSAVQYAHQRLIIHRDIKPSNILVATDGVPKLLDFGIAKIIESDVTAGQIQQTLTVFRVLTPGYSSPEQVKGEPITTASDVYSLGVVLYELLTGYSPYRIANHTPQDIFRAVCEFEPEKPSTAVRRTEAAGTERGVLQIAPAKVSAAREGSPEKLGKRLKGDLDNIVLMALRKEPQRRYASVEQFAEDLRRHLKNLPVIARKDTVGYRATKFITRHKVGVAASFVVAIMLVAGIIVTLREARIARAEQLRAQAQQLRAEKRFNDVRSLANSLIFEIHDSISNLPGATPARKVLLDRALQYLDSLAEESRGDSSLQRELATAYQRIGQLQGSSVEANLGDTEGALASFQKALAISESVAKANPNNVTDQLNLATGHRILSMMFLNTGRAGGHQQIEQALAISGRLLEMVPSNLAVLRERSVDFQWIAEFQGDSGDYAAALESVRNALMIAEILAKANPQDPLAQREVAMEKVKIANELATLGSRDEALEMNRSGLDLYESLAKDKSNARGRRELAVTLIFRGNILIMNGDAAAALENFQRSLATLESMEQADPKNAVLHTDVAGASAEVGRALTRLGRHAEGLTMLDRATRVFEQLHAQDPSYTDVTFLLGQTQIWRGEASARVGNARVALDSYRKGLANLEILANGSPTPKSRCDVATALTKVGQALVMMKSSQEASAAYQKSLDISEPLASAKPPNALALYVVADSYSGLGDVARILASIGKGAKAAQIRDWTQARDRYKRSLEAWHQLPNPGANSPNGFECGNPRKATRGIALCDAALAKLSAPTH